jgi:hypothetical protein
MRLSARPKESRGIWRAAARVALVVFFFAGILFVLQGAAAQGDGSFETCAADMEKARGDAYDSCGRFVERSPAGDSANVRKAKEWLELNAPKRPYVRYLKSLSSDEKARFVVYQPDMTIELPLADRKTRTGKLKIARSFGNLTEEAMLRKAEAVYPAPAKMIHQLFVGWGGWPFGKMNDSLDPIWGTPGNDEIFLTHTITARAVRYYYDMVIAAEKDPKMPSGFEVWATDLDYQGAIHYLDRYKHGEDSYEGVYVANLDLNWSFVCGGLCGMGFTRNKMVVLDRHGEVIALYLDAPGNSALRVS